VRFFPSAAAAAEAGYRPCLRCRPERAPDIDGWHNSSAVISQALRLIAHGVLDEVGVDGLARRLHITERHLRRLFRSHLGASPIAVAQTQRFHLAKKLIDETRLPITEVAFCSGYSSIRRFNAAFKKAYGRSPSTLRRGQRVRAARDNHDVRLMLPYKPPFDWDWFAGYLSVRALRGVEHVDAAGYRRSACIGDASGVIEVRPVAGQRQLQLIIPITMIKSLAQIIERVQHLFDLKTDPHEIKRHLSQDPALADIMRRYPAMRVPGCWDPFELAVRAVLGQSISIKAAATLGARLAMRYGERVPGDDPQVMYVFPAADVLRKARLADLGISNDRAQAIRALAQAATENKDFWSFSGLPQAVATLTQLPGIGQWTAHYIAMRALREPDAFPAGDLVLRRAAGRRESALSEAALIKRAEPWRPWRAYAAMCLWNSAA